MTRRRIPATVPALAVALALAVPGPAPLDAQSMDDLFEETDETTQEGQDQPDEDTNEGSDDSSDEDARGQSEAEADQDTESDQGVDIDSLTTSPLTFSGSVSSSAGISLGFEQWPGTSDADGRDALELLRGSGLYDMSARFDLDARPHPKLRFHARIGTELNEDAMRFTSPSVDELFVDYTFGENLFVRAGKQNLTWGEGRLLSNPANLVDRLSDGVALRASYPLGGGSLTGAVYSIKEWVSQYRSGSPRAFAYAARYDNTFAGVTAQVASHYKYDELTESSGSLNFGLGPVDLSTEGVARWKIEDPSRGVESWAALGQFFWERGGWSLLGEYEFDSTVDDSLGHFAALGLRMPAVGDSDWRPRIRWRHAFGDNSGEVLPAISGSVAPKLSASVSLPVVYGAVGSYYREAQGDVDPDEDDLSQAIPVDDVLSLLLGISLTFSF
jgi:hypothetical protein